jgi:hypothetical protein
MTHVPLTVQALTSDSEITLVDEMGHFILQGTGEIHTSLSPGRIYIQIAGVAYPLDLKESATFEEPATNRDTWNELSGSNVREEPIVLDHFICRRQCPACQQGVLVGRRDTITLEMLKEDNCLLCGQPVEYKDLGIY